MNLSTLLTRFEEPQTLRMTALGAQLKAEGKKIISLSIGEPDFDTPEHIKKAAIEAIEGNWSHYSPVGGYAELKEAIVHKFERDNQLSYGTENVIVSTGAKQTLANAILSLVNPGDEVIIPAPYWVTYTELVKIAGGHPVIIPTDSFSGFKITSEQLEKHITAKTKAFLFSSPCNPSGAIYNREELKAFSHVFEKHPEIFVISDEIYEYINYIGAHESIAQFDSIKDRVIVINGLSKGFAMTGWRIGYCAAHKEIVSGMEKLQGQITSGTCSIAQRTAIAALRGTLEPSIEMKEEFLRRRDRVVEIIKRIPDLSLNVPDGAFYLFPNVSKYFERSYQSYHIKTSEDLCMYLLNEAHVTSVMGEAFGNPNCIRFSFANSMENLVEAWENIEKALSLLK